MSTRKLCDWSAKRRRTKTDKLRAIVSDATDLCLGCGRAANSRRYLCKPVRIHRDSGDA